MRGPAGCKTGVRAALAYSLVFFLGGCVSISDQETESQPQLVTEPVTEVRVEDNTPQFAPQRTTGSLSSDLLYELLVASIAMQRNDPVTALDSLSRAAKQSQDKRLITQAIQLAMSLEDYELAAELSRELRKTEPDNYAVILSLARAQFNLGNVDTAYDLVFELASDISEDSPTTYYDIATVLQQHGGEDVLTDFIDRKSALPDNANLDFIAALLALKLQKSDEFYDYIDTTLALRPNWEEVALLKLTEMFRQDMEGLQTYADTYIKDNPDHNLFRLQYARVLIQQGDVDQAQKHLEKIIKEEPDASEALFTLALVYTDKTKLKKAKEAFSRHLDLNPRNDQARMYLADVEIQLEQFSEAVMTLHGVASEEYYLEAQIKLARLVADRDGVESGLRHLRGIDAFSEDQAVRVILEQDALLREFGQLDRARSTLSEGLEQYPDHPDLLYYRGLLAAQMDELVLHENDMRRLIEIEPENAHAYNALGYTLADKTDRLDEAMELITKANELLPNNPFILDSMGWVHFRLGNNTEAIAFLRQALDARPDAEIAAHLGEVLWITGKRDEALKIWEIGIELGPDNAVLKDTIERFTPEQSSTEATDQPPGNPEIPDASQVISSIASL